MFGKKSQSSLIIVLGIVSVALMLWMFSLYKQTTDTEKFMKSFKISKIQSYIEMFKGYSRNALTLSSHKSSIIVASKGGNSISNSIRSWICTSPNPPSVNELRYFLSETTKDIFNSYLFQANRSKENEGMTILIDKASCVDYDVDETSVLNGENDERFNVGAYGSHIYISYDFDSQNSTNSIYEEVARNRIWYMYRIFRQWAEENNLRQYMCECMGEICGCESGECNKKCSSFNNCLNNALNNALNDLQSKFDEYVECSFTPLCCYQEKQSCGDINGCTIWEDPPSCNKCNFQVHDELCSQNNIEFTSAKKIYSYTTKDSYTPRLALTLEPEDECSEKIVEMWNTVKASTEAVFTCKDRKYALSVSGEKYIIFNVHVSMSLQSRQCYSQGNCQCEWNCEINLDTGRCIDGTIPVCKQCVPTTLQGHWCTQCH